MRKIVSSHPIQSGFLAERGGLRKSPLAKSAPARSSNRQLCALSQLELLGRGHSSCFDVDEFPARPIASAKTDTARVGCGYSSKSGFVEQFQVFAGSGPQHSVLFPAEVCSRCAAARDLVLDLPGDELSI